MSDSPPPDGRPHDSRHPGPPPPPPPPGLTGAAPPGYAAYDRAPSAGTLSRIGGSARALVIMVAIVGVTSAVAAVLSGGSRDAARDFREGRITETEFLESYLAVGMLGLVQLVATVAAFVLTVLVMFRMASNHRKLGRTGTWAPGWAIGGWFVPPLVIYVVPFLMFRELWKASDPDAPTDGDQWKSGPVSPIVFAWWVLYGLVPLGLLIISGANSVGGGFASSTEALARTVEEQFAFTLVAALMTLTAAIVFIVMIRQLSARHRRLTGES